METSVVTVKGQIVIPSDIRRRHKIEKGTRVAFLEMGKDILLRPITDAYIEGLKGFLGTHGRATRALLEERRRDREREK